MRLGTESFAAEERFGAEWSLILHGMLLVVLCCFCIAVLYGNAFIDVQYIAAAVYVGLIVWIAISWRLAAGSFVNPYLIFVIVASVFNGGDSFLDILHVGDSSFMKGRFDGPVLVRTLLFASLSFACLHTGALIASISKRNTRHPEVAPETDDRLAIKIAVAILVIAILPAYLLFRTNISEVASGGYAELYRRNPDTGFGAWKFLLSQFLLPAAFMLAAARTAHRRIKFLSLIVILAYAALNFYTGYRTYGAAALAAYGWVWHTRVRRLPAIPTLLVTALLVFILFPAIRVYRKVSGEQRQELSTITRAIGEIRNPAVSSMSEMGGSMQTIAYTIELVPSTKRYEYGASYGFALLTVLPNIFGTSVHPSIAHGKPSTWLIRTVAPLTANSKGGLGYSFIAEAYLNFGWMGPWLVLLPLGWMIGKLQFWLGEFPAVAGVGAIATILFFLIIYVRNDTSDIVRGILWYGLLPLVTAKAMSFRASQTDTSSSEEVEAEPESASALLS